jgi:hypothetical protein
MISQHEGKLLVVCDGCPAMLVINPARSVPIVVLRKRGWRLNTRSEFGWQHFCRSCAVEFRADEPVMIADEVAS